MKGKVKDWSKFLSDVPSFLAKICAMWTIHYSKKIYLQTLDPMNLTEPHCVQILTIFRFLGVGEEAKSNAGTFFSLFRNGDSYKIPNHLCEVVTGGGKSIILGITSTLLALLGFKVHCACYSKILSNRDYNAFKDFWELFDIQSEIQYSTMSELAEKMINENGNVRELTENLYLKNSSDGKKSRRKVEKSRSILLFDEVDVFFQKDFLGKTYNPVATPWREGMKSLMKFAWSSKESLEASMLTQKTEYKTLEKEFGSEFMSDLAGKIVNDLEDVSGHEYVPTSDGRIGYRKHGSIDTGTYYGYITAFCYLQELERKNQKFNQAYVDKIIGEIHLNCGNFSYAEIPKSYEAILGVTGTLSSLTKEEKDTIVKDMYGIKKTTIAPSIYGDEDLVFEKQNHIKILKDKDSFHQEIQKSILSNIRSERSTLVFF